MRLSHQVFPTGRSTRLQPIVLVGSLATYQVRDERAHRSFNHFSKQLVGNNRSVCTANTVAINHLLSSTDTTSTEVWDECGTNMNELTLIVCYRWDCCEDRFTSQNA